MSLPAAERPLAGCCIVTTRPEAQAAGLPGRLEALGAEAINFPVIAIEPIEPAPLLDLALADADLVFFVSANAVAQAASLLPREAWPAGIRVATVGPASARALAEHGWCDVIVPQGGFDSEAVLALPEFSAPQLSGQRVLILKGEGGRELLASSLIERGASVRQLPVYRRCRAPLDPDALLRRGERGGISALVFSASEGLRFFLEITGERGRALVGRLPCFAPHPRILNALREAGAEQAFLSEPGDDGIIAALLLQLAGGRRAPSGSP